MALYYGSFIESWVWKGLEVTQASLPSPRQSLHNTFDRWSFDPCLNTCSDKALHTTE